MVYVLMVTRPNAATQMKPGTTRVRGPICRFYGTQDVT